MMKTLWDGHLVGVLFVIVSIVHSINCSTTKYDTYEIDEEPLSFGDDKSQFDELTTYQLDSSQHKILDLALAFDSSYTITSAGWFRIKKAAKQLVDGLDISPQGTHVSLMKFSTDVETFRIFEEDDDKEKIKKEIDELSYDGEWSRIDLAVRALNDHVFASDSGARSGDVPKAVVLFTDGRTDGQTQPDEEVDWHQKVLDALKPLKEKKIVVFAVAVGAYADKPMLTEMTLAPPPAANDSLSDQAKGSGKVFELGDIGGLINSLNDLSAKPASATVVTTTTVVTVTTTSTPVTEVTAIVTTTVQSSAGVSSTAPASASPGEASSSTISGTTVLSGASQSSSVDTSSPVASEAATATPGASLSATPSASGSSPSAGGSIAPSATSSLAASSSAAASLSPSPSSSVGSSAAAASSTEGATSAVTASPSASNEKANETKTDSLSATATPAIVAKVTESVVQTVHVTVQATQTVYAIGKGN